MGGSCACARKGAKRGVGLCPSPCHAGSHHWHERKPTSENQAVATSEKPPGTWLLTPEGSRGPRPRRRPRRGHNLGGKDQGWSWVGAPALGGGQSRCPVPRGEPQLWCSPRIPQEGVSAAGKATKPTACTLRRCAPDWGCAGPSAWSLHKVLQVVSGNPWVVHAGAPGDVYRQGTSGEGGHRVERGQKKSRGWFSFQVPGRGSRRPRLAARTYATAGGQGVK